MGCVRLGRRLGVLEQRNRLDTGHYAGGNHKRQNVYADQQNAANTEQHEQNAGHRVLWVIVELHFDQVYLMTGERESKEVVKRGCNKTVKQLLGQRPFY